MSATQICPFSRSVANRDTDGQNSAVGTLKPTLRLRKLGLALRHYREAAGLTLEEAAEHLMRHASSISRVEKGLHHCPPTDVEYYLIKYGVTDPAIHQRLYDLSRTAKKKGWWHAHKKDLSHQLMDFISLEADAAEIEFFELILIPGLLQHEEYARALLTQGPFGSDPERVERLVTIRMRRQEVLTRPDPPQLAAVIDEAALHRQVGSPEIMQLQLHRLIELSTLPQVKFQVLPLSAGAHWGVAGAFKILHLGPPSDLHVVTVDSLTELSYREKEHEIRSYSTAFDRIRDAALSPADSRTLIEQLVSEI